MCPHPSGKRSIYMANPLLRLLRCARYRRFGTHRTPPSLFSIKMSQPILMHHGNLFSLVLGSSRELPRPVLGSLWKLPAGFFPFCYFIFWTIFPVFYFLFSLFFIFFQIRWTFFKTHQFLFLMIFSKSNKVSTKSMNFFQIHEFLNCSKSLTFFS